MVAFKYDGVHEILVQSQKSITYNGTVLHS